MNLVLLKLIRVLIASLTTGSLYLTAADNIFVSHAVIIELFGLSQKQRIALLAALFN